MITGVTPTHPHRPRRAFRPVLAVLDFERDEVVKAPRQRLRRPPAYGPTTSAGPRCEGAPGGHRWSNLPQRELWPLALQQSGYGRDNASKPSTAFLQTKTVWVRLTGATSDPSCNRWRDPRSGLEFDPHS